MKLAQRLAVLSVLFMAIALPKAIADNSDIHAIAAEMHWRMIGPFRGGRTVAVSGVVQKPNTFYMAANNGGVWKSTDFGVTWKPIFDGQPTGSIGSLAVAPSNPDVVYVGSGEGLQRPDLSVGDGIYKSIDAGKTWQHLGLRDGYQIPSIVVDPKDPNRIFVAVLGHPYGPNPERGIFRSTDGGQSFERVLYKDENTGAIEVAFDPNNPENVYATLWAARQAPWEVGASFNGPGSGLFKSADGGSTWQPIGKGLPTIEQGLGRIGFAIAKKDSRRMYALVDASSALLGLYRSDDAGVSWTKINGENRIAGRGGDFAGLQVDPENKDKVYVANTSTYRSEDAGKTFVAIKGAPGGDDYHTIWINPNNPDVILLGVDQGATLTVNGGQTWSSWYNQPTAQFYHVITDNRFPYWVYGGQQESGSIGIASRSDYGSIRFRDWQTVGVEEYGYVAPDPLNPNFIYGGKATRFNRVTGDVQDISPQPLRGNHRFVRTMPLLFSPADPHTLFLASEVLFKTTNGGNSWEIISPDLTRKQSAIPDVIQAFASQDPEAGKHRGVIYSIAPSPRSSALIWTGTDDGLIHLTRDGGKNWTDVTPPELTPWSKVSLVEASHFDSGTAYAAINRFRLDDLKPHLLRTHDFGKTWTSIVSGLPDRAVVNAVREDPKRSGLLFAGTEIGVFVSLDDGDHWKPLQQNLPVTSVRDLVIHENDLVVGTHGRSFWILDDITPLRQLTSQKQSGTSMRLFVPANAMRWRWNRNTDTPLPPEEPVGENPPDGAIITYALGADAKEVTLQILDSRGNLVRSYSSKDKPLTTLSELGKELNVPTYWVRPDFPLSAMSGCHRFIWDLRYSPPQSLEHEYPISAIYRNTPRLPVGVFVQPGQYSLRLTVDGNVLSQPLLVVMDPRIKTTPAGLQRQFVSSTHTADMMNESYRILAQAIALQKAALEEADLPATSQDMKVRLKNTVDILAAFIGSGARTRSSPAQPSLSALHRDVAHVFEVLQSTDSAPTTQALRAVDQLTAQIDNKSAEWNRFQADTLKAINTQLKNASRPELTITSRAVLDNNDQTHDPDEP